MVREGLSAKTLVSLTRGKTASSSGYWSEALESANCNCWVSRAAMRTARTGRTLTGTRQRRHRVQQQRSPQRPAIRSPQPRFLLTNHTRPPVWALSLSL